MKEQKAPSLYWGQSSVKSNNVRTRISGIQSACLTPLSRTLTVEVKPGFSLR